MSSDGKNAGNPAISIVVPVYNVQKYLGKCLDSVLAQSFGDFELICVNDGSTDSSADILAQYVARDTRIRIVNRENGGLSAARNTGAAQACGKYLYFLDSDDWIEADTMELCYRLAEENSLDEVIFDVLPEYESPELMEVLPLRVATGTYDGVLAGKDLLSACCRNRDHLACACLRFLRRSFYTESGLNFQEGIIHEDEIFSFQCDLLARRVMYLKRPLYHYFIRRNSIMTGGISYRNFRAYSIVYLESLKFLALHPGLYSEVSDAIQSVQDGWLYVCRECVAKLGKDAIRAEVVKDVSLIPFMEILHQYERLCKANVEIEIANEKRKEVLNSGSYKLGRLLGKILTFWRAFKK